MWRKWEWQVRNIFTIELIKEDTYIAVVCIRNPGLVTESLVTYTNKNDDIFDIAKACGFYHRIMWLS